ncbi:MAG: hypothetical protein ACRC2K_14240 [Clostridium sp.]
MFKIFREKLILVITLIVLSTGMYCVHFLIFNNIKETVSNIILSLAYVPIGIFYNILIIDKILEARERIKVGKKMNMITGAFFHEIGTDLLKVIIPGDVTIQEIRECSEITSKWDEENFGLLKNTIKEYDCVLKIEYINLDSLNELLDKKDDFILNLIANPTLEEYEEFTDMLIAILHVKDELSYRLCDCELKEYEKKHLTKDICKAYVCMLNQWVDYIAHLKIYYPALFIKALINSPFDNRSKVEKDKEYLQLSDIDIE